MWSQEKKLRHRHVRHKSQTQKKKKIVKQGNNVEEKKKKLRSNIFGSNFNINLLK